MLPGLRPPHLDYFRLFYADTAMFGGRSGLLAALDFFGPGRLVFATDAPLGPIRESVAALDRLALSDTERAGVMGGTADGCSGIRPRADRCLVAEHCWDPVGQAIVDWACRFERLRAAKPGGG